MKTLFNKRNVLSVIVLIGLFASMTIRGTFVFVAASSIEFVSSDCDHHHHDDSCDIALYHPELDVECGHESHLRALDYDQTEVDLFVNASGYLETFLNSLDVQLKSEHVSFIKGFVPERKDISLKVRGPPEFV